MNEFEILSAFFCDEALKSQKKLGRITRGGKRYYYDSENNSFKIGITSFLSETMKTPWFLEQWKANNGPEIAKERARYGTDYHVLVSEILRQKKLDCLNFNLSIIENEELRQDLLGLISWTETANPQGLLIEGQVYSQVMDLAATLDFFGYVEMPVKGFFGEFFKTGPRAGEPKETTKIEKTLCIIDHKTAIKHEDSDADKAVGMYNKLQLNYQRLMLKEMFPEYKDKEIRMYNLITKNWRTNPDMQITEIESIPDKILIDYYNCCKVIYSELFNINNQKLVEISGNYTGQPLSEIYKIITVEQYCKSLMF